MKRSLILQNAEMYVKTAMEIERILCDFQDSIQHYHRDSRTLTHSCGLLRHGGLTGYQRHRWIVYQRDQITDWQAR